MTIERRFWDARYASASGPGEPSTLLRDWLPLLPHGRALDMACGTGANALALAAGMPGSARRVTGVDVSPMALRIAAAAARDRGLAVNFFAADLQDYPWPPAHFDVVCVFRYLDRRLVPVLHSLLKPGGWLVYETFTVAHLRFGTGPRSPDHLLQPGELRAMFAGWAVLHYEESVRQDPDGARALAGIVTRRP